MTRPAPILGSDRAPGARLRAARVWMAGCAASVLVQALVGALGDSAATPGLGRATATPPWDVAGHPPAWLVTVLLAVAQVVGAVSVGAGLRAVAAGFRPSPRAVGSAALVAVAVLVLVPPVGSADHLSYVAYGRIAAAGDDPYAVPPVDWRGGHDPVAGAVQPPWQHAPSVYGPVATAAQAAVAVLGNGSLRLTVWWWQVVCGAAFLLVGMLLHRRAGPCRARASVVWSLNPLLLGQLVLGAHVDVLATALGLGGLVLVASSARPAGASGAEAASGASAGGGAGGRWPVARGLPAGTLGGGLLLGAAVGTKLPYALFGLAALWSLRALPWRARLLRAAGIGTAALAVLVPAHLWAGPHVFDQLGRASRFTSIATPWRAVVNVGDLALGRGALAPVVAPLALLAAAALAVPLWHRLRPGGARPDPVADGVRAAAALAAAWVLTAPYALPWYDAMVWAPLALVPATVLDGLLLARLAVIALAYVPGRTVGLTPAVQAVTLGMRRYAAPVLVLAVIVAVVRWAAGAGRAGGKPGRPRACRAPRVPD